jgi:hypothetical protein
MRSADDSACRIKEKCIQGVVAKSEGKKPLSRRKNKWKILKWFFNIIHIPCNGLTIHYLNLANCTCNLK